MSSFSPRPRPCARWSTASRPIGATGRPHAHPHNNQATATTSRLAREPADAAAPASVRIRCPGRAACSSFRPGLRAIASGRSRRTGVIGQAHKPGPVEIVRDDEGAWSRMLIASPAHQVWEMRDDAGRINAFAEQLPIRFVEGANKERRQRLRQLRGEQDRATQ